MAKKKRVRIFKVANSELNSDWLKYIDNGKWQNEDLRAHDASIVKHRKDAREKPSRKRKADKQ